MRKPLLRNSKGGFSLPAAMAITATLIILSSSLIFIAMTSISTTSMDVSGRQAYLNVRSALEYAEKYYQTEVDDYTGFTTEYMSMNDKGGTITEGASVSTNITSVANSTTYVVATYIENDDGDNQLKLSAYSKYADSFGKRQKLAQLSVTFNISQNGGNYRRITVISTPSAGAALANGREITFNIKQAPEQDWTMAYYAWTYVDRANIYGTGTNKKETCDDIIGTPPSVADVNKNENTAEGAQIRFPANPWVGSGTDDQKGPGSIAGETGDGWYTGLINPAEETVNYVNVILAKKGAVINNPDGTKNSHSQTPEMFHLWYLNPSDRNIYFEFLKSDVSYYFSNNWNGKTNIEDTVLVYARNPMTTVHFKSKGLTKDDDVLTSATAPVINGIYVNGTAISGNSYLTGGTIDGTRPITMQYEGCGWWVATVETDSSFTMNVSYSDGAASHDKSISVSPNARNEAWVVANGEYIQSRQSEENANVALGVVNGSYVTIHAKALDNDAKAQPILDYSYDESNFLSLSARQKLNEKIIEAQAIESDDYTEESYNVLFEAIEIALKDYNNTAADSRIQAVIDDTSKTRSQKVSKLTEYYTDDVDKINTAIDGLIESLVTSQSITNLKEAVTEYNEIVEAENNYDGMTNTVLYDYSIFNAQCLNIVNTSSPESHDYLSEANTQINSSSPTITDVHAKELIEKFKGVNAKIKENKIDKDGLNTAIDNAQKRIYTDTAYTIVNTKYTEDSVNAVKNAVIEAKTEFYSKTSTASSQQLALDKISNAIDHLVTISSTLNTTDLVNAVTQAGTLIANIDPNVIGGYTDSALAALTTEKDNANAILSSDEATQEQVDDEVVKLNYAIKYFNTPKPNASDDILEFNHKIRIYFNCQLDEDNGIIEDNYRVTLYNALVEGEFSFYPLTDFSYDSSLNCRYTEVDKNAYKSVSVSYSFEENGTKPAEVIEGTKYDISAAVGEIGVVVMPDTATHKVQSYNNQLMTLYIEKANFNNDTVPPTLTVTDTSAPAGAANSSEMMVVNYNQYYYLAKFQADVANVNKYKLKITAGDTVVDNIAIKVGQYVVKYTSNSSADLINANDIYPKYVVTSGSGADFAGNNINSINTTLVSEIIANSVSNDNSNGNSTSSSATLTTKNETFEIAPSEGKTIIIVKNVHNAEMLYGWIWPEGGSGTSEGFGNTAYPGKALLRYKLSDYYYTEVPNTAKYMIISKGNGDANKLSGTLTINSDADSTAYSYLIINDGYNGSTRTNTAPQVQVTTHVSTDTSVSMVFVGGEKVRFRNRSYQNIYGSSVKKDEKGNIVGTGNPFGGVATAGYQGDGRVGATTATAMYDWYEYKIPVDAESRYNFTIDGLNKIGDNTSTREITEAYGDVWFTLNSTTSSGGKYTDLSLYTFDPEKTQIQDNVRIYFRVPTVEGETWSNIQVSYYGVITGTSPQSFTVDANVSDYSYVDIPKTGTFLTITATVEKGGVSVPKTFVTSLQGGDNVLFDPTFNSNFGGWDSYTSPQDLLKREVLKAQTIYYGSPVVNKYDDDGRIAGTSTYSYVEKLKTLYRDYTNMVNPDHQDWTLNTAKIYSLTPTDALNKYNTLHSYVTAYTNLVSAMSEAKSYIATPLSGEGRYPEYINSGNQYLTFDSSTITNLRNKLASAQSTYLNEDVSVDSLKTAASNLNSAVASVSVINSGSIAIVFYDTQNVLSSGSTITVSYTDTSGNPFGPVVMSDKNTEGYPIVFLKSSSAIKNVSIKVNGVQRNVRNPEQEMQVGEAWVFMDYFKTDEDGNSISDGEWRVNSVLDYRQINADEFTQTDADDRAIYTMLGNTYTDASGVTYTEYKDMVLYFQYDTKVKYGSNEYQIKAGAYTFTKDRTDSSAVVKSINTTSYTQTSEDEKTVGDLEMTEDPVNPGKFISTSFKFENDVTVNTLSNGTYTIKRGTYTFDKSASNVVPMKGGKLELYSLNAVSYFTNRFEEGEIDLYSAKAKDYFTNPQIYGVLNTDGVKTSTALGWTNANGKFTAGTSHISTSDVNMVCTESSLSARRSYSTTGNMYFRFEDDTTLDTKVTNFTVRNTTFILAANRLVLGSSKIIDGTSGYGRSHFYLTNSNSSGEMVVEFKTDMHIKYYDARGAYHDYYIREGTYKIKKQGASTYVADLFDENYWKDKHPINGDVSTSSSDGKVVFTKPSYENN